MTTINYYVCDFCGSKYDTSAECTGCESSHIKYDSIVESKHEKVTKEKPCVHPYAIKIKMTDGQELWHRRENY